MSQPHTVTELQTADVAELVYRLKARLALANFKRQHGYEKYDLYTLETNLLKTATRLHPHPATLDWSPPVLPVIKRPPCILKRPLSSAPPILRSPLSAQRSTPARIPFSSDDRAAAQLLVMLRHNHVGQPPCRT